VSDTDQSDQNTDSDSASDADIVCEPYTGECELSETKVCRNGSVYQCEHIVTDGCVTGHSYKLVKSCDYSCEVEIEPSSGIKGVANCGEYPDVDDPDYCPKLTEIDFPLKDKDGNMTLCRPCDKPTEKDPHCIANIWKDSNERLCVDEPEHDCCGYPCEMTNLKPRTKKHMEILAETDPDYLYAMAHSGYSLDRCDIMVNPRWWGTGNYTFKTFGMSEGKILLNMTNIKVDWQKYPGGPLLAEFDTKTLKYKILTGQAMDNMAYYKGAVLILLGGGAPFGKYITYRYKDGKMELVYPNQLWDFALTPALNGKWAFGSINEGNSEGAKIKYAKVGEWEWTEIGKGSQYRPFLVGDKVTFYLDNFKGYQCDLSKSPESLDDCILLNRENEEMWSPVMDLDNEQNNHIVYYTSTSKPTTVVKVDVSKAPFNYEEFELDVSPDGPLLTTVVDEVHGNLLSFKLVYGPSYSEADRLTCFYRLDTKKTFCTKPVPWEYEGKTGGQTDMGADTIENHILLWQDDGREQLKARDMECYCDWNPELCPFDDYIPNTDHPKRDGFREERCEDKTKCDYTDIP